MAPLVNRTRCDVEFVVDVQRKEADTDCRACIVSADTYFDERVWFKQVFGFPYGHITDCSYADDPCQHHTAK